MTAGKRGTCGGEILFVARRLRVLLLLLVLVAVFVTTRATVTNRTASTDTEPSSPPLESSNNNNNNDTEAPNKVIAVIEFMQETNSFSPVPTTLRNFQSRGTDGFESLLSYNSEEILDHCTHHETAGHVAGFLKAVQDHAFSGGSAEHKEAVDLQVVPLLQARSVSGGPLTEDLYQHFQTHILHGLEPLIQSGSLQGVYLSLHGAMGVEGRTDPEGDLLEALRQVVGPTLPIAVTHDLHANLTKKRMKLITFLVGYRTNPHRDYYNVGYQAGKLLVQTIQGRIRPTMAYRKMRLLKGGGWTMDFLSPMRQIFNWMTLQEKTHANLLSLSNFMVHLWLDHDELGWATVAVTDNDPELAEQMASELADLNWDARTADSPMGVTPKEALRITQDAWWARYFGTTVWCDVSDAVGAGAPGESTWILQTLLDHQQQIMMEQEQQQQQAENDSQKATALVSYLTLRDAQAVNQVFDPTLQIGDTITLQVGGNLDLKTNRPVTFTGTIFKRIHNTESNPNNGGSRIAILRHHGIHLILNEVPSPLHSPSFFTHVCGLSLWEADIVVVKNLFPFRYRYLWYNRQTIDVVTPGVTNIDVFQIPYTQIPRPIYPLDKDLMDSHAWTSSWRPEDCLETTTKQSNGSASNSNDRHIVNEAEQTSDGEGGRREL